MMSAKYSLLVVAIVVLLLAINSLTANRQAQDSSFNNIDIINQ